MDGFDDKKSLFSGVRGTAIKILNRVERTDAYLDKLLDAELRSTDLNDLDKSLLTEIVTGVLRWQMKLDWVLNGFFHGNFSKAEVTVRNGLRTALYQIMFLDKIPHHAAVNEAVEFIKRIRGEKAGNLVNAVLRTILRNLDGIHYPDINNGAAQYLSVMYSHPLWMVRNWMNRYGYAETEKLLAANNAKPQLTLRINTAKTTIENFLELLGQQNITVDRSRYLDSFVKTATLTNLSHTELFRQGYVSVQDESAGIAASLLDVRAGERVIDLCAAPGGKTTFFGERMQNKGEIIAVDKYSTRLNLVKDSSARLGITNVTCIAADGVEFEAPPADKVLLDAPCSGLGVLTKKPDVKIKREQNDIRKLTEIQRQLIDHASTLVKPGGSLVYSTCTIEPDENFSIIRWFLQQHPEFDIDTSMRGAFPTLMSVDGCIETLPSKHGMDGSFAIRLKRTT
ncbi:MAG TPA: 16S rRNA (cytosine(967)-C(5))-methyltransferase RsmB [Bacteroidota bacterium]|nr:16S rRNA (cytosine(967)-C(5))-methyltransferase RsmB [Bacteroidota bacterium]